MDTTEALSSLQLWRDTFAPDLIGVHTRTLEMLASLRRIASTNCDVLITGASGTGKELVARALHRASDRDKRPFVALNCAAIPKELIESEIFGHAKGAFTGASERRAGKFEQANGGVLFLDEIGEMDLSLQSKLLRVLQERELTPVGDANLIKVDVRIFAATNQNLEQLCQERAFREDLYYRLDVVPLHLPTLTERREDIPHLVKHFLKRANLRHGRQLLGLDPYATTAMCAYSWPGNIRELHNVIERIAVLKPDENLIGYEDLPAHIAGRLGQPFKTAQSSPDVSEPEGCAAGWARRLDINEMLTTLETHLTLDALKKTNGNKARAAELLGLKRTTLVERLKKLNLERHL